MYILIADSGSTKTDWVVLSNGKVLKEAKTIGFNPYFQTKEEIKNELERALKPELREFLPDIKDVYYYGTGCSTSENCQLVKESIHAAFAINEISVFHDLLAAARALCGREWGIAAILGTGSNSCLYNGSEILENVPSTGYLWSDYGGGSQIGKFFIREYFESRLPAELKEAFEKAGYNREVILNNVYKKGVPGRYLASVSHFVSQYIQHPFVKGVLTECFDSFFTQQIGKYTNSHNYKVHTVGSIGVHYKALIAEVGKKHGYEMGKVIKSPIEGLINFHAE
jgi:N-acetylglucosamine kinase-like BadF-type ATPase